MKTKSKLLIGIGLLFAMITMLTFLSTFYIDKLAKESKNILVANYNSIEYCREMLNSLNNDLEISNQQNFEQQLSLQQKNITEKGEAELTKKLSKDFTVLKNGIVDSNTLKIVQNDIIDIMQVNMEAIVRKDKVAQGTAQKAVLWIGFTGAVCFLIAFIVLFNLPGNIANPIKKLTESIKEIAAENYSQRIHFEEQNEFGELAAAFNTMGQKLEEFKNANLEKIFVEKKRIETLINNMHDPVIGLDEKRKVLFMNDVALNITGLKIENVLGKSVQDIAVTNDLLRTLVQDIFEGTTTQVNKIPVKIYADNKESYFEKEIIPIKIIPTGETKEKLIGTVILLQNITPYKELEFAKTNFIGTVSHELKTPIASIKMSLQLLNNKAVGDMNKEQHTLVESIMDDANRLLKISGELLNMTQVESGSMQLSIAACDAEEILNDALGANKTAADQKNIKLEVNVQKKIDPVFTDADKTAWVLTNLISNAIRYSYENSTIKIAIAQSANTILFTVEDYGQGISQQHLPKIFDRYFRIPGSKKEGTGLGLSISKELIESLGGKIIVKSELASGSLFSVILPTQPKIK